MSSLIAQLVQASRILTPAALLGWWATVMVCAVSALTVPSLHAFVLMAGSYGLVLGLWLALLLVPLSFVPWRGTAGAAFTRDSLLALGVSLVVGAIALWPVRYVVRPFIPTNLAYGDELAFALSIYGAAALGVLASWLIWQKRHRAAPTAYPLWTVAICYCGARSLTVPLLQLIAPGREGLFDAALIVVLVLSALGIADRLSRRVLLALTASWALSVAVLLVTVSDSPGARAELFARYPGAGALLHGVRKRIDRDGDGISAVLGATDCNDRDSSVHPLAIERVADGIDQNCNGFDPKNSAPSGPIRRRAGTLPRSIVLVTADTVRADLLTNAAMPRLSALAAQAATFTRSYASAPYTAASLTSVMTGHTSMSTAIEWGNVLGAEPTLAEILGASGFDTTMVMYNWWGDGKPWAIHEGFEHVVTVQRSDRDSYLTITGPEVTRAALAEITRLTQQQKPFFLWIHYLDPHAEYAPRVGTPYSQRHDQRSRYLQEVWATDHEIGRVIDALEQARFFEHGLFVAHSDHGELIEDHGRTGHAYWLTEDVLRTVLVLRGAGVAPQRYATRVRLLDVMPTLLDMGAGLTAPTFGRTLRPILEGTERADREVVSYSAYQGLSQSAILVGPNKLLQDAFKGTAYLYDITRDSAEEHNLIDDQPRLASQLRARLAAVWDSEINDVVLRERSRRSVQRMCNAGDARACATLAQ